MSVLVSEDCMRSHVTSVSTSWTFGLNRRTYWENSFLLIFETLLGADICGLFDYLILDWQTIPFDSYEGKRRLLRSIPLELFRPCKSPLPGILLR